jgi:hypothetical protein
MSESSIHDYLPRNRRLAAELIGRRLRSIVRLEVAGQVDEEEPARLRWGRALMEAEDGRRWLLDAEESLSNILLWEVDEARLKKLKQREPVWTPIATAAASDPLAAMVRYKIIGVEEISRPPPPPDWQRLFEMCGVRLTFEDGQKICVGTHLTESQIPGVWFVLPDEVDSSLIYRPLAD